MSQGRPGVAHRGFWRWKRKQCSACRRVLDASWDHCPYCAPLGSPGAPAALGWLVPVRGERRGQVYTLGEYTGIGSDPPAHLCLPEPFVSARHAEIRLKAAGAGPGAPDGDGERAGRAGFVLRDLGSTNGSFVNDERISERALRDGDILRLGSAVLVFKAL